MVFGLQKGRVCTAYPPVILLSELPYQNLQFRSGNDILYDPAHQKDTNKPEKRDPSLVKSKIFSHPENSRMRQRHKDLLVPTEIDQTVCSDMGNDVAFDHGGNANGCQNSAHCREQHDRIDAVRRIIHVNHFDPAQFAVQNTKPDVNGQANKERENGFDLV